MMEQTTFKLKGMSCASCANTVERVISRVSGVEACTVNFGMEQAMVQYHPQQTTVETIQNAIEKVGYGAFPLENRKSPSEDEQEAAEAQKLRRKVMVGGMISAILVIGVAHSSTTVRRSR